MTNASHNSGAEETGMSTPEPGGDTDAALATLAQASTGLNEDVTVTHHHGDPADDEDPDVLYIDVACVHATSAIECAMTITVRLDSIVTGDPTTIIDNAHAALAALADEVASKARRAAERASATVTTTEDEGEK